METNLMENHLQVNESVIEMYLVFHWWRKGGCCVAARCCGGSPARARSCSWSGRGLAGPRGRPALTSSQTAEGERAAAPGGTLPTCGSSVHVYWDAGYIARLVM